MVGKYVVIMIYIDQWKKLVFVGGDILDSDGYMFFYDVDVLKGGVRVWVNCSEKYFDQINEMIKDNIEVQEKFGFEVIVDKNWVFVKLEQIL